MTTIRSSRAKWSRRPYILGALTFCILLFQIIPIIIVVFFSFNASRSVTNFTGFSFEWYEHLFQNNEVISATLTSLKVAFTVGVVAVVLGSLLALGLSRLKSRETIIPEALISLVFTTPEIAMGVSLLLLFTSTFISLSAFTIILGHITFSISYVVFVVRSRLSSLRLDIEEAAVDLGASRLEVLRLIILPQLWPALLIAFGLVFLLSFDDFVVAFFTSGIESPTLPIYIYGMLRRGLSPEINAIGTVMITIALIIGAVGWLVISRKEKHNLKKLVKM